MGRVKRAFRGIPDLDPYHNYQNISYFLPETQNLSSRLRRETAVLSVRVPSRQPKLIGLRWNVLSGKPTYRLRMCTSQDRPAVHVEGTPSHARRSR